MDTIKQNISCCASSQHTGGKEVLISRKTAEAVLRGAPIYVPGIIACSPGVCKGDLVAVSVAMERPGRWDGYEFPLEGLGLGGCWLG